MRELSVVSKAMLNEVCARPEAFAIEHLVLAFMPDKKIVATIATSAALPRLTKVTLGVSEGKVDKVVVLAGALARARKLESVAVTPLRWYQRLAPLAEWLEAARGPLAHVPSSSWPRSPEGSGSSLAEARPEFASRS